MDFTQVATIPKTAQRCKAEGIGLSARQLRHLCATGQLKHTMMGRNVLIYWPNVLKCWKAAGRCRRQRNTAICAGWRCRMAEIREKHPKTTIFAYLSRGCYCGG